MRLVPLAHIQREKKGGDERAVEVGEGGRREELTGSDEDMEVQLKVPQYLEREERNRTSAESYDIDSSHLLL